MLSEQEQRSLQRIERRLRAEDHSFTRSFELFELDLESVGAQPSPAERLVLTVRRALAVATLLLIPLAWLVAMLSSGDLATISRLAVLPASAVLLAVGCVVHPDRGVRPGQTPVRSPRR